jgi:serine/threonine kinase 32
MAPEIITGAGYSCAVDWWSLGVVLFETVCGERPFRSKMRRELIKRGRYKFPESAIGLADSCRSLIAGFLQMDPKRRLGYGPEGLAALHTHPFFDGLSWRKVESKAVAPIYVPDHIEPNYKTDASVDDLLQFLAKKRKPLSVKSLAGTIFQGFSVGLIVSL